MKVFATVMKVLAALAVIAGIVYVVATYGDKIVAWAKGLLAKLDFGRSCEVCYFDEEPAEEADFEG